MQVEIDTVVIRKRVRYSLGDLSSLMESLRKHGQLSPILINRRSELIAGNRRLESARRLGWKSINAIVIDKESESETLELELEENVQRKDLRPEELREAIERMQRLQRVRWWQRAMKGLSRLLRAVVVRPLGRLYARLSRQRRAQGDP
ncbi:MAG: ParB N-terminal domain-containing protein [Spirochaetaceae bacterium]|nr:ParB N-terminal domain-containing protein [Spirochaetaceae bacterium]